jgi:membrane protein required for colicin V production
VLVGGVIGLLVSHLVRLSIFSGTDRAVGGLFGLLRGLVMAGLFVMLCHAVRLEGEPWWHRSLLVPYAEHAANVLRAMVGERKMLGEISVTATR